MPETATLRDQLHKMFFYDGENGPTFRWCEPPLSEAKDPYLAILVGAVETMVRDLLVDARRDALLEAADAWTQGAWADTPRHAERARDRMAAAQFFGDWLRARAAEERTTT